MQDSMEFDEHCSLAALAAASSATDEGDIGRHYLDSRQLSGGGILAHLTHLGRFSGSQSGIFSTRNYAAG